MVGKDGGKDRERDQGQKRLGRERKREMENKRVGFMSPSYLSLL